MRRPSRTVLAFVVPAFLFANTSLTRAQHWSPANSPATNWTQVASSADGAKVAATVFGGLIYNSIDSGATWNPSTNAMQNYWASIASSADGSRLVACDGRVVITSQDSGTTWDYSTEGTGSMASSADGNELAMLVSSLMVIVSRDGGQSWAQRGLVSGDRSGQALAMSADGAKLVAVSTIGGPSFQTQVIVSTDYGTNWSSASYSVVAADVVLSADGSRMAALAYQGNLPGGFWIYVSADSGNTWTQTAAPWTNWSCLACSADGSRLVAAVNGGLIYTSPDFGTTWAAGDAPSANWVSVASSADGNKLVAAASGGPIYTSQSPATPRLRIAAAGGNVTLSWIVPSSDFVLQQNPGLGAAGWTDVSQTPTLNYPTLEDQVTLPTPAGPMFYRLAAR
jgi:hypothetical protein